ncbi:hypothetical protein MUK42_33216 [Musa troglodytarum]|uniref:Uncharacterized protein n=1 Tax=Musa troglodytarum TaxID=320322 RepID=A0A9E7H6S1_9LILI|nr:hypothetical protein MUK42_33216 [Musa troglodytarum]
MYQNLGFSLKEFTVRCVLKGLMRTEGIWAWEATAWCISMANSVPLIKNKRREPPVPASGTHHMPWLTRSRSSETGEEDKENPIPML